MNQILLAWLSQVSSPVSPQALHWVSKKTVEWDTNSCIPSHEPGERMQPSAVLSYSGSCEVPLLQLLGGLGPRQHQGCCLPGSCSTEQDPSSPSELLWFDFVFPGMVHKSHWTRWDEKGTLKILIKCCFPHAHRFSVSRQGHSLKSKFLCIFITVLDQVCILFLYMDRGLHA